MPPSQLKRLKSSLREQGITGPQKSKKAKKASKSHRSASDRNAALQHIRDDFNPFEVRTARPAKYPHANSPANGNAKGTRYKDVLHRPGVSKSAGEEMRKAKLLPELQRRNKIGGLVDRRIGEGDVGMSAEERAVQRYAREKERRKGGSVFDLEGSDDDEPMIGLTHGGRDLDDLPEDDFAEPLSDGGGSGEDDAFMRNKRRRIDDSDGEHDQVSSAGEDEPPERKKSKKEVMEEVIAKSKMHKYERQQAKEDDDELRMQLDEGMSDIMALLKGHKAKPPPPKPVMPVEPVGDAGAPFMNPERQKLLDGNDRAKVDKEYDSRLKQLAQDARAKPSERSKTEEEKVKEDAERLKDLEDRRMKRMRGEEVVEEEDEKVRGSDVDEMGEDDDEIPDEAAEFGFASSNAQPQKEEKLVLDDEDEFAWDEDLIASGSDADLSEASASDSNESDIESDAVNDEEDEFVKDILGEAPSSASKSTVQVNGTALAYTYPCPNTHTELLAVIKDSPVQQLPTIIQRIRALHHPSLSSANKAKTAAFSNVLVEHLTYMGTNNNPLDVTEQVIRHLHSLSRTYATEIATAFRSQLAAMSGRKDIHAGDLIILTAIGSIYPTSDHFHAVVTPAMAVIARWLDVTKPDDKQKHSTGAFLVALCIKYQELSKRFVPEAVRFTLRALEGCSSAAESKQAHLENLMAMANLWSSKPASVEIFRPAQPILKLLNAKKKQQTLKILLQNSLLSRRPLELHHHRRLPIRTSVPKFEDNYHPDKHYDPDKERAESKKLQKEYKRERKGALRELRKDANFVARQQLQDKKERDREYERKYRRLVAEVQGEEK